MMSVAVRWTVSSQSWIKLQTDCVGDGLGFCLDHFFWPLHRAVFRLVQFLVSVLVDESSKLVGLIVSLFDEYLSAGARPLLPVF